MNFKIGYVTDTVHAALPTYNRSVLVYGPDGIRAHPGRVNASYTNSKVLYYYKNRPVKDATKGKKIWEIEL